MQEDMTSTWTRPLTFYGRTRLTFIVSSIALRQWGTFMRALWSTGATVSLNQTDQPNARNVTVSGNGKSWTMTQAIQK